MKFKSFFIGIAVLVSLFSCVGEDIVTVDEKSVVINGNLFSVATDETDSKLLQLEAQFSNTLGDVGPTKIVWESDNPSVLEISDEGVLSPKSEGEAIITAKVFKASDVVSSKSLAKAIEGAVPLASTSSEIIVGFVTITSLQANRLTRTEIDMILKDGFPTNVRFDQAFTSIDINETDEKKLVAIFTDLKNRDTNESIMWSSSDETILTVSTDGVLTPIKKGKATVTASVDGSLKTKPSDIISNSIEIEVSDNTVITPTRKVIGSGNFVTNSVYDVGGSFEIIEENGKVTIELSDDFLADAARIGIYGSNSTSAKDDSGVITKFGDTSGAQTFDINFDISRFQHIFLFCEAIQESVGFGTINR